MEKVKRVLDKPTANKLDNIHKQLESFFGLTKEEYLDTRAANAVIIRFIGCHVALEVERVDIEFVAQSFGRDRTTIYHMIKQVDVWQSMRLQYSSEYETLNSFVSFYKGYNNGEVRVYMVDDEDDDEMSNDEFILHAEAAGRVYSLSGFESAYNNREFVYTSYSIRILNSQL
jgi:hypothetical protein